MRISIQIIETFVKYLFYFSLPLLGGAVAKALLPPVNYHQNDRCTYWIRHLLHLGQTHLKIQ